MNLTSGQIMDLIIEHRERLKEVLDDRESAYIQAVKDGKNQDVKDMYFEECAKLIGELKGVRNIIEIIKYADANGINADLESNCSCLSTGLVGMYLEKQKGVKND